MKVFYPGVNIHQEALDIIVNASIAPLSKLRETLAKVCVLLAHLPENKVAECLLQVAKNDYDGSDDESYIPHTILQAVTNSKMAHFIAIQDVIDGTLS